MKEIGEYLRDERRKNGVSINEASEDLEIEVSLLEALEDGNHKAFKDIFTLKENIATYAKYLGLDVSKMLDEFNDFLFEKTSKISLDDIKKVSKESEKVNRVSSPYTKIKHTKYDLAPIILVITILLFISLIAYIILKIVRDKPEVSKELMNIHNMEVLYEYTK